MASESTEPPDLNEGSPSSKSVAPVCKENFDCGGKDALDAAVVAQVTTSMQPKADVQDIFMKPAVVIGDIPRKSEIEVGMTADDSPDNDVVIRQPGPAGIPQVDRGLMGGPDGGSFVAEDVEEMPLRNTGKGPLTAQSDMPSSSSNAAAQVPKLWSQGEFGKILQISQWSLTHRIQVCKILQDSGEHWRMSVRSRHEYARQSLDILTSRTSLIKPPLWDPPNPLDGFDGKNWESKLEELEVEMEKLCFQSWPQLTTDLKSELEALRKADESEEWYDACKQNGFKPQAIFQAVEKGDLEEFKTKMGKIRTENWTLCPREYGGATPLHWAALHGEEDMVSFIDDEYMRPGLWTELGYEHDVFGFTPSHMALFPTLWPTYKYPEDSLENIVIERDELARRCSRMMDTRMLDMWRCREVISRAKKFMIITADIRDDSKAACFVASSLLHRIGEYYFWGVHPLALAVCIAHPSLIEKFVVYFKHAAFGKITNSGGNILHLVAMGGMFSSFECGRVMTFLLSYSSQIYEDNEDNADIVNLQNRAKKTPLHIAIAWGNHECVAALLEGSLGTKKDIPDENGHTPFSIASKLVEMSTKFGAVRDMVDFYREHNRKFSDGKIIHNDMPMFDFKYKPGKFSRKYCNDIATIIFGLMIPKEYHTTDGEEVDVYDEQFRKILQRSEWSLTERIYACKLLQQPFVRQMLDPLTRREYAQQSLSLMKKNIQSDGDTSFASIIEGTLDLNQEQEPKLISRDWAKLASQLEKVQDNLRENDTHKHWYKAFEGKSFEPHEIFEAVELNLFRVAQWMMNQITRSLLEMDHIPGWHWAVRHGNIKPGEYRGATPLHWAVLHGNRNMVQLMIKEAHKLEGAFTAATLVNQDKFEPIHMAILSLFMDECFPVWDLTDLDSLIYQYSNSSQHVQPDIDVYKDVGGSFKLYILKKREADDILKFDRTIFGANKVLSPMELPIYIAEEEVVEDLLERYGGFEESSNGDTLLHFAARGFNSECVRIMNLVLRHLHLQPGMLNSRNKDGETPLHIAILHGKDALVEALLRCHYIKVDICKTGLNGVNARIKDLITNHPQGQRHMQLLQLSQWSLRHRILAIQMFIENENDEVLKKIRDTYVEQCRSVVGGDSSRRNEVAELTDITKKLREKLEILSGIGLTGQQTIHTAIEEGSYPMNILSDIDQYETRSKVDHMFSRYSSHYLFNSVAKFGFQDYAGANLFHWATLHGRADIVDSICSIIKADIMCKEFVPNSDYENDKEQKSAFRDEFEARWDEFETQWTEIVDARDDFGFTPLHLVAFPFPWQSNHTYTDEDGTQKDVKLVEKLCENKFPHCASRGPRINFMLWNCSDDGNDGDRTIYVDDHFPVNFGICPFRLAIHMAHPCVVEKLLEKFPVDCSVKHDSSGNTILHDAEAWNALIKRSGDDQWRRIKTNLLELLDSPLNSKAMNVHNNDNDTPLHKAVRSVSPEWLNVLLQCKHIKFDLKDSSSGNTILHDAEAWNALTTRLGDQWKRIETILLELLDRPSNSEAVNVRNNDSDTPLHKAVRSMSPEWVNVLLRCEHIKFDLRNSSSGNTILHDAEAWNTLTTRLGDQWKRIEAILLELLDRPSNSEAVNVRNNDSDTPLHKAVRSMSPEWVNVLLQCEHIKTFDLRNSSSGNTILHDAEAWIELIKRSGDDQWRRMETNLLKLLDSPSNSKAVNVRNSDRDTPLHMAVHGKSPKWVNILVQCEHIKFNLRDAGASTPLEIALKMLKKHTDKESAGSFQHIQRIWTRSNRTTCDNLEITALESIVKLIHSFDPESKPQERETLQRERQVYVDAANAILVGAALIASASFGAWLQPPLGYQAYYSPEFQDTSPEAPPGTYESYVAIKQHWILQMFWIFNSLAFFFSLATVIAGADAAIPWQEAELKDAVASVRRAVKTASALLGMAIVFVICTFATLGFAVLPPIEKYKINMWCTLAVGVGVCIIVLILFLRKLVLTSIRFPTHTNGADHRAKLIRPQKM